jgi:hypothetical protein
LRKSSDFEATSLFDSSEEFAGSGVVEIEVDVEVGADVDLDVDVERDIAKNELGVSVGSVIRMFRRPREARWGSCVCTADSAGVIEP